MTEKDLETLHNFIRNYPDWWFKIGVCALTRDFDCAPEANAPEASYGGVNSVWDKGFSVDHSGSIADAINHVMSEIEQAITNYGTNNKQGE